MFRLALKLMLILMLNPILIFMFQIQDCAQASGSAPASSFSTPYCFNSENKIEQVAYPYIFRKNV